ncbi:hypothetical protein P9112_005142 [Eukaryota sp. TZLM1-RC]
MESDEEREHRRQEYYKTHERPPQEQLQEERRDRRHRKHGTHGIHGWFRYGPHEQLPFSLGDSGPNGCFVNLETKEVRKFKPEAETQFKFYGPKSHIVPGKDTGPMGGDFDLRNSQLFEPRDPDDPFYKDMYM